MRLTQSVAVSLLIVLLGLSFSSIYLIVHTDDLLVVAFLDVGQGDAVFIEAPNKVQVLIDAGRDRAVLRELSKVMSFHDRSIDLLIETHPDKDHIGGFPDILKRYDVSLYIEPGVPSDIGEYSFIQDNKTEKLVIREALDIDLGGGVLLRILFPDRDVSGMEKNAASLIIQVVYGEHEFLLTGDSPKSIEKYLVSQYGDLLESDVLKAGHHGSKTSSDVLFVETVDPEYVVVSAGIDNRYGHPHQEVLEIFENKNTHILGTYDMSTIVFVSDGKKLELR